MQFVYKVLFKQQGGLNMDKRTEDKETQTENLHRLPDASLSNKLARIEQREKELEKQKQELAKQEKELEKQKQKLAKREQDLDLLEPQLEKLEQELKQREQNLVKQTQKNMLIDTHKIEEVDKQHGSTQKHYQADKMKPE